VMNRLDSVEGIANAAIQWAQVSDALLPMSAALEALHDRVSSLESRIVNLRCRATVNLSLVRLPLSCVIE